MFSDTDIASKINSKIQDYIDNQASEDLIEFVLKASAWQKILKEAIKPEIDKLYESEKEAKIKEVLKKVMRKVVEINEQKIKQVDAEREGYSYEITRLSKAYKRRSDEMESMQTDLARLKSELVVLSPPQHPTSHEREETAHTHGRTKDDLTHQHGHRRSPQVHTTHHGRNGDSSDDVNTKKIIELQQKIGHLLAQLEEFERLQRNNAQKNLQLQSQLARLDAEKEVLHLHLQRIKKSQDPIVVFNSDEKSLFERECKDQMLLLNSACKHNLLYIEAKGHSLLIRKLKTDLEPQRETLSADMLKVLHFVYAVIQREREIKNMENSLSQLIDKQRNIERMVLSEKNEKAELLKDTKNRLRSEEDQLATLQLSQSSIPLQLKDARAILESALPKQAGLEATFQKTDGRYEASYNRFNSSKKWGIGIGALGLAGIALGIAGILLTSMPALVITSSVLIAVSALSIAATVITMLVFKVFSNRHRTENTSARSAMDSNKLTIKNAQTQIQSLEAKQLSNPSRIKELEENMTLRKNRLAALEEASNDAQLKYSSTKEKHILAQQQERDRIDTLRSKELQPLKSLQALSPGKTMFGDAKPPQGKGQVNKNDSVNQYAYTY